MVRYYYDSWGKITSITDGSGNDISSNSTHIANINPIRYRSYYFDTETGYYYLNSRYYSPDMCRFINADVYASTGQGLLSNNMFAYCLNNPVNRIDVNGSLSAGFGNTCGLLGIPDPTVFPSERNHGTTFNPPKNSSSSAGKAPKGNNGQKFIKTVNQTVAPIVGESVVDNLSKIKYKPYVSLTNPLQLATVAMKNSSALVNNTLKVASKSLIGIGTVAAFGYDVYQDYSRYGENTMDYAKAVTVSVVCIGLGAVATAMCFAAGPLTIATGIVLVGSGVAIGISEEVWKKSWIGY